MEIAQHAMDRRVARTRAMLHEALMSLILEKPYEAITITDICAAAKVGRSTFYAHYTGKDDLKRDGLENLRSVLADRRRDAAATPGESAGRRMGFSLPMFEHARDHLCHYRALAGGPGGAVALGKIREIVSDLAHDEIAAAGKKSADPAAREFAVQYVVGAYMAVLTWWLDGGAKLPPQRVDAMFQRLATSGAMPPYS